MLVLTRKSNQSIMIGDDIEVSVLSVMGEKVRLGITAPRAVPVFRKEVYLEIQREQAELQGDSPKQPEPSDGQDDASDGQDDAAQPDPPKAGRTPPQGDPAPPEAERRAASAG